MSWPLFLKLHKAGYEKGVTLVGLRKAGNMSGFSVKQTFTWAL